MSFVDQINDMMKGVRQSKNAIPIGLVLTLAACVLLTLVTHLWVSQMLCLLPMIVALVAYYIPTYFGLRDRKKLAIFGLALFLVVGLALGGALYKTVDDYEPVELSSEDNLLIGGIVSPSHGEPGDAFQFTVYLTSGSNSSNVRLLLLNNWGTGENPNVTMAFNQALSSGLVAAYTVTLTGMEKGIYYYQFGTFNGTNWITTEQGFGPVNADLGEVLSNSLISGTVYSFYSMAVLFYILILLTWWMDRSKKKIFEMEQKRAQTMERKVRDEKFVCSECGAEVPADADKCPGCGEKFDDEDLKCPQCSAKLLKTDTKCWNCGKKL